MMLDRDWELVRMFFVVGRLFPISSTSQLEVIVDQDAVVKGGNVYRALD